MKKKEPEFLRKLALFSIFFMGVVVFTCIILYKDDPQTLTEVLKVAEEEEISPLNFEPFTQESIEMGDNENDA